MDGTDCTGGVCCTGACDAWLTPWKYRVPISMTNSTGATLTNYQVLVSVDTQDPIAQSKMKPDGSDIQFTATDGVSPEPAYWIEPLTFGTTSTKIWVKVSSIPTGPSSLYMYYGNSAATISSSETATFVQGVIADSELTNTPPGSWQESSCTGGGCYTPCLPIVGGCGCYEPDGGVLQVQGGGASLSTQRTGTFANGSSYAYCQTVTFPAPGVYQVVFGVYGCNTTMTLGRAFVSTGGDDVNEIATYTSPGLMMDDSTSAISAGTTSLCIGTAVNSGTYEAVSASFYDLRVRQYATPDVCPLPNGCSGQGEHSQCN